MKKYILKHLKEVKQYFSANKSEVAMISVALSVLGLVVLGGADVMAQVGGTMQGEDKSGNLAMAASTLKTIDTVLFTWIAPLLAGVFVITAGVWMKDQRYSLAALSFVAALMLGTAGSWVTEIFSFGGDDGSGGVFNNGQVERVIDVHIA